MTIEELEALLIARGAARMSDHFNYNNYYLTAHKEMIANINNLEDLLEELLSYMHAIDVNNRLNNL